MLSADVKFELTIQPENRWEWPMNDFNVPNVLTYTYNEIYKHIVLSSILCIRLNEAQPKKEKSV